MIVPSIHTALAASDSSSARALQLKNNTSFESLRLYSPALARPITSQFLKA